MNHMDLAIALAKEEVITIGDEEYLMWTVNYADEEWEATVRMLLYDDNMGEMHNDLYNAFKAKFKAIQ